MAGTSANVQNGIIVAGAVHKAATSASAPTSTTSTLTGFTDQGYIGEGGVEITPSVEIKEIKDGFTGGIVATVATGSKVEVKFTLIENSKTALETYHGTTATTGVSGGSIQFKPSVTGGAYSWVIDAVNPAGTTFDRYYFPSAALTAREPIKVGVGEPPQYGITLTANEVAGVAYTKFSTALTS